MVPTGVPTYWLFLSDTELTDGLKIDSMLLDADGKALEVCAGGKTNPEVYQTSIPTSAIRAVKRIVSIL